MKRNAERFAPIALALAVGCTDPIPIAMLDAGSWKAFAYAKPRAMERDVNFGAAVALAGDDLIIGGPGSGDCGREPSELGFDLRCRSEGIVSVLSLGTILEPYRLLRAPEPQTSAGFSRVLTVDDDWLFVGATGQGGPDDATRALADVGVVFVYRRSGSSWDFVQELRASEPARRRRFGAAIAVDGEWAAVLETGPVCQMPRVPCDSEAELHILQRTDDRWAHHTSVRPAAAGAPMDTAAERRGAVAAFGDRIFVGLPFDGAGSVHVYELAEDAWVLSDVLRPPEDATRARFGDALAFDGERLYVGAPGHEKVHELTAGANGWVETRRIEEPRTGSRFGAALAVDRNRILIGAPREGNCETGIAPLGYSTECQVNGRGPGAAFLYARNDEGEWIKVLLFKPTTDRFETEFGASVAMIDDWIVVGAPGEPNNGQGVDAPADEGAPGTGAVFVYAWGP